MEFRGGIGRDQLKKLEPFSDDMQFFVDLEFSIHDHSLLLENRLQSQRSFILYLNNL